MFHAGALRQAQACVWLLVSGSYNDESGMVRKYTEGHKEGPEWTQSPYSKRITEPSKVF